MLHFLQVVQAFGITLKSAFQWHIIARSNMLSETKIALEYDLKRVINTCWALLKQVGHLTGQLCALFHYQVSSRATELSPLCHSECDPRRRAAGWGVPSQRNELLNPPIRPLHSIQVLGGSKNCDRNRGMVYRGVAPLHHWK